MNPFRYKIGLKVYDSSIEPEEITALIGFEAFRSRKRTINGLYYWVAQLADNISTSDELDSCLKKILEKFEKRKEDFSQVNSQSKNMVLDIATFGARDHGFVFDKEIIQKIQILDLDVDFFIYPGD